MKAYHVGHHRMATAWAPYGHRMATASQRVDCGPVIAKEPTILMSQAAVIFNCGKARFREMYRDGLADGIGRWEAIDCA